MLRWGYPLSPDTKQLLTPQGHLVNDAWFLNIRVVKQVEYVVVAYLRGAVVQIVCVSKVVFRFMHALCG